MYFRSRSKAKPVEEEQRPPAPTFPKSPITKSRVDDMIDLEKKLEQSKITEEKSIELLTIYTVGNLDEGPGRIL